MSIKEDDFYRVKFTGSKKHEDIVKDIKEAEERLDSTLECASITSREYLDKKVGFLFKKNVYKTGYFIEVFFRKNEYPNYTLKKYSLNRVFESFELASEYFNDIFEIATPENDILNIDSPFKIISDCWCGTLCLVRDIYTGNIYIVAKEGNRVTGISPYYTSDQKILTYREWKKVKWAIDNESTAGRSI